jgi:hypothetical protein
LVLSSSCSFHLQHLLLLREGSSAVAVRATVQIVFIITDFAHASLFLVLLAFLLGLVFYSEDGGSTFLRNAGKHPPDFTAPRPTSIGRVYCSVAGHTTVC